MEPREFVRKRWWSVFGYVRETLTRILPILLLILFNAVLIYIVKTSRKRMKSSVNVLRDHNKKIESAAKTNANVNAERVAGSNGNASNSANIHSSEVGLLLKNQASKRSRQENQLTWMSIVVGQS